MTALNWPSLHGVAFKGSRVLVTGAAGFIGSHLVDALVELGASVVALDDLSGGCDNLASSQSRIESIRGSILDDAALERAVKGCRFVFHEAAKVSVPASVAAPREYEATNTTGTFNVLEA